MVLERLQQRPRRMWVVIGAGVHTAQKEVLQLQQVTPAIALGPQGYEQTTIATLHQQCSV